MNSGIKTIGIIGEGKMGTNLFYYLLDFGFSIVWLISGDSDPEKLQKAFLKKIKRSFDAGLIDQAEMEFLHENILITQEKNNLASTDLIIEAVSEDLELKKSLFSELDRIVDQRCIFTSNSSSINPSELIPSVTRQDKFAGLHFFYPVSLKNITELIITEASSEETKNRLTGFLDEIKREYILLSEDCSFILNRIYLDLQNEAFMKVSEGKHTIFQVDEMVKNNICPAGVFEFCDHVGNDIMLESVRNYTGNYTDQQVYQPFILKLQKLVLEKRLGIKTGEGFYMYDNGVKDHGSIDEDLNGEQFMETVGQLQNVMKNSLLKWAERSKIPPVRLNAAMKEYLGSDQDIL